MCRARQARDDVHSPPRLNLGYRREMIFKRSSLFAAAILFPVAAAAQDHASMPGMDMPTPAPAQDQAMPGMDMGHHTPMPVHQGCLSETVLTPMEDGEDMALMATVCRPLNGSGTSRLPSHDGGQMGPHWMAGDWMLMAHGYAFGVSDHQSGPRGDDKGFVGSMGMLMAERMLDDHGSKLQFNSMLSLEPLMGQRGYPSLFATGETAHGAPLVDRQHPHDLFMELSGRLDIGLSGWTTAFLYGGPVAEPALGPSAFMHRRSSRYLPLAPISHHWFDSTHISYGVVTAGVSARRFQIEGSAFRGREPDENRWDIETPKLDSWSLRASWLPTPDWAVQVSHGRLESPEAAHPLEDEARTTASVQYAHNGVSAMIAFSAKDRLPGPTLTAWLAEANWEFGGHHTLFGRIENVANDELFPDPASPLHDHSFRVTRAEAGYAWRIGLDDDWGEGKWNLALGGTVMAYAKPAALDAAYGRSPFGATLFARLSFGD
jgi:hypothetical protein